MDAEDKRRVRRDACAKFATSIVLIFVGADVFFNSTHVPWWLKSGAGALALAGSLYGFWKSRRLFGESGGFFPRKK